MTLCGRGRRKGEVELSIGALEAGPGTVQRSAVYRTLGMRRQRRPSEVGDRLSAGTVLPAATSRVAAADAGRSEPRRIAVRIQGYSSVRSCSRPRASRSCRRYLRGSRMMALVHERLARQVPHFKLLTPPVPMPGRRRIDVLECVTVSNRGMCGCANLMRGVARAL